MHIQTHPEDRKVMVKAISEFLGKPAEYLRTPTYAYQIGAVTVNHDGSVTCDNEGTAKALIPMLLDEDFLDEEEIYSKALETEPVERGSERASEAVTAPTKTNAEEVPEEGNGPTEGESGGDVAEENGTIQELTHPDHMTIERPVDWLWVGQMRNYIFTLYSRQLMLNHAFGMDLIYIDAEVVRFLQGAMPDTKTALCKLISGWKNEGKIRGVDLKEDKAALEVPFDESAPLNWTLYTDFFNRIVEEAQTAKRVKAEIIDTDNDKYYMHGWLQKLGFGGSDFKALRNLLLSNLKGWCAFKDAEAAEKHKNKYIALRKTRRAGFEPDAVQTEPQVDEANPEGASTDE